MMEIGRSPTISTEGDEAWRALNYIATHSEMGVEKRWGCSKERHRKEN